MINILAFCIVISYRSIIHQEINELKLSNLTRCKILFPTLLLTSARDKATGNSLPITNVFVWLTWTWGPVWLWSGIVSGSIPALGWHSMTVLLCSPVSSQWKRLEVKFHHLHKSIQLPSFLLSTIIIRIAIHHYEHKNKVSYTYTVESPINVYRYNTFPYLTFSFYNVCIIISVKFFRFKVFLRLAFIFTVPTKNLKLRIHCVS